MPGHANPMMKSLLTLFGILLTALIWWAAIAVTDELNASRHIEDQKAALTLNERTMTSPAVWAEFLATLGNQEIERLFEQQGSRELLVAATEKLLFNAIAEYRSALQQKQQAADDINDALQTLGQAFFLEMLVDFDALETAVPAIAEAFVADLEQGELADNFETTLNAYFSKLSQEISSDSLRDQEAVLSQLGCAAVDLCLTTLETTQEEHQRRAEQWLLWLALALAALLVLGQFGHRLVPAASSARTSLLSLSNIAILALLVPGIFVPMMTLKAFIEPFSMTVGGAVLEFDQQLLMYQNKSIADLVTLLLETGQHSLWFLAAVMTLFCVLIPVSKCLAALFLLLAPDNSPTNPVLRWLAIDSGKWSMADVFVVALIMAFIGMDQLIASHTSAMNALFSDAQFVQAASASELAAGFYFFLGFVALSFWTAGQCRSVLAERAGSVAQATAGTQPPN